MLVLQREERSSSSVVRHAVSEASVNINVIFRRERLVTGHIRGRKYCFSIHMLQKSGKDACPNNPAICCKFCDIKSACHDPCTGVDKYNICSAQITLEEYLIKLVGGSHL